MRRERRVRERTHAGGGLVELRFGVVSFQFGVPAAQVAAENGSNPNAVAHAQVHVRTSVVAAINAVDMALTSRNPTAGVVALVIWGVRFAEKRNRSGAKRVTKEITAVVVTKSLMEVGGFFLSEGGDGQLEGALECVGRQGTGLE